MRAIRITLVGLSLGLTAGCATLDRDAHADLLAKPARMSRMLMKTDPFVPPAIAQRFIRASGSACARGMTVPGADHENGWTGLWRELLAMAPNCD